MNSRTAFHAATAACLLACFHTQATETIALGAKIAADPGTSPQYMDTVADTQTLIDKYTALCNGKAPAIVQCGGTWSNNHTWAYMNTQTLDGIRSRNAIPEITWQSTDSADSSTVYATHAIAAGTYDSYINQYAAGLASYSNSHGGAPLLLRFDHEMNGWWYPWSTGPGPTGTPASTTADYIAAWKHVHQLFVNNGATNVRWVFCVSNDQSSYASLVSANFPGASYVDWLAFDAYNFGTGFPSHPEGWVDFPTAVGTAYSHLDALGTNLPMMINEMSSGDQGGTTLPDGTKDDKGKWTLRTLLTTIPQTYPKVQVVSWFHQDNLPAEPDWRINSIPTGQTTSVCLPAYQQAATSSMYNGAFSSDGKRIAQIMYEAENLAVADYSGPAPRVFTGTQLSGGAASIQDSTAVGNYVTYDVPLVPAGTYDVRVGVKKAYNRGTWQLAVGRSDNFSGTESNVGTPQDEYAPSDAYVELDLGNWSPSATGDKWFQFKVTLKNSASAGYTIAFDYIKLLPQ
jgi:beta-mannanase